MSEGPWIRFFPSDWLAGTRGMTAAETGIYITLIAMMYERGEPIPNDTGRLARLCGTTTAALKSTLSVLCDEGKLVVVNGGLWNERVGIETEIRREKSTSAQKSAGARWGKDKQKQQTNPANAVHSHSERNANQKPDTRDRDAGASLHTTRDIDLEFETEFWPAYPRKVGKGQALKAYRVARRQYDCQTINEGARRYAAERAGQDQQFTRHAATWLNGQGWLDEPTAPTPHRQSQAPPMTPHQQRHQAAIDAFDRRLGVKRDDEFTGNTLDLERADFGHH